MRLIILLSLIFLFSVSLNAERIHWNKGRGYSHFHYATAEGVMIENFSDTVKYDLFKLQKNSDDFRLKFRTKNINAHPSKKYPYINSTGERIFIGNPSWGFFIQGETETLFIEIKGGEFQKIIEQVPGLEIVVRNDKETLNDRIVICENISPHSGDNLWEIVIKDGTLSLLGGNNNMVETYLNQFATEIEGFGFFVSPAGKVLISDITLETSSSEEPTEHSTETSTDLDNTIKDKEIPDNSLEGYWTVFDRDLEESLVKLGGNYILYCKAVPEGYEMYYVSGSEINTKGWSQGDLKLKLLPTPFEGIFNVCWIDAMKEEMKNNIQAQTGEGNTLLIQLPYQNSKVRLRKLPDKFN